MNTKPQYATLRNHVIQAMVGELFVFPDGESALTRLRTIAVKFRKYTKI